MSHTNSYFIFPIQPSPYDGRDYQFEIRNRNYRLAKFYSEQSPDPLPKTLDLRTHLKSPRDQGARGTCVAFSCAAIKEYQERLDCNFQEYMSPNSVYYYRENKPTEGMHLRDAMKILNTHGIATEQDFPYTPTEPKEFPNVQTSQFSTAEYARVNTINGLKEALYNYGPCLIAFPVYSTSPEFWRPSSSMDESRGGHCVTVVGYNEVGFILRNSWGSKWNIDGCVLYPYSDWGSHWEVWSCIDAETDIWYPDVKKEKFPTLKACFRWMLRK